MNVSRETAERLARYGQLIERWNPRINLVAPATIADLQQRHIADSLQISNYITPKSGLWADLGSGGGLPGIVLAVAFADLDTRFVLVESDQRKATFLRTCIRELGLSNATVQNARIEAIDPLNAAYLSARALAPLPKLMPYLQQHLAAEGRAFLMKGRNWQQELGEARSNWRFDVETHPSNTQDGSAILEISGVSHV